jgi:hypothetical protein
MASGGTWDPIHRSGDRLRDRRGDVLRVGSASRKIIEQHLEVPCLFVRVQRVQALLASMYRR